MSQSFRVAIAGHVDHGKSTVIGRLLSDTQQVRNDKFEKIQKLCDSSGRRFEYAFLLDALEEEQQQGITIDVTEVPWLFEGREYTIIDTPGHREFLKNMVGGASRADAAVLVVDAQEGLKTQFQRQVAVMAILGIPRIIVVINKMDLISWSHDLFVQREGEVKDLFAQAGLPAPQIIPTGAWLGVNLIQGSTIEMPWYKGPSLARAMANWPAIADREQKPTRFTLQDVYKFDDRRIYVGRLESGILRQGDEIEFLPSGGISSVKTIEFHGEPDRRVARPGDAVGITLTEPLFLERGEVGFTPSQGPQVAQDLIADIFWLSDCRLKLEQNYGLRCGTAEVIAKIVSIENTLNAETLKVLPGGEYLEAGSMGRVTLKLERPMAFDPFEVCEATGRFVLIEDYRVCGGGKLVDKKVVHNLSSEASLIKKDEREVRYGHLGFVLWMTGLSGAGKSTIAKQLERRLFDSGMQVNVLDGDNIRRGVSSDLGFCDRDRQENIRRVAEIAKLFAEAGMVTITAFISPFSSDRERAREIIGADRFIEVFVDCPFSECEKRDPKNLYVRARQGEIENFTGLTSKYEIPPQPDIHLLTDQISVAEAVDKIVENLKTKTHLFSDRKIL